MRRLVLGFLTLCLIVVVVGFGVLAFWEVPPPTSTIEKSVPNDRLSP
jgi:hypothetical protein